MSRKPTAEQVERMRPPDGWAGVKFVITERAMSVPNDGTDGLVCRLHPPGLPNATAGDIFSLSAEEAEGLRPELWLRQGLVEVYREPPKLRAKKVDGEGAADGS